MSEWSEFLSPFTCSRARGRAHAPLSLSHSRRSPSARAALARPAIASAPAALPLPLSPPRAQDNLSERRREIVAELAATMGLPAESAEVQAAASSELETLEELHHGE